MSPGSSQNVKRKWKVSIFWSCTWGRKWSFLFQSRLSAQHNLVLSTGLIVWIGYQKEIRNLTFRALALPPSMQIKELCGLFVVYIRKDGTTLLVGVWQREKQQNKLVEWKAFVHIVRIKSADLKHKSVFVLHFCGFPHFLDVGRGRRLPYVA